MANNEKKRPRFRVSAFVLILLSVIAVALGGSLFLAADVPVVVDAVPPSVLAMLVALAMLLGLVGLTCFLIGVVWWGAQLALRAQQSARADVGPQLIEMLQSMNDRLLISDQAKRIAYRQRDRDALRDAIVDDIRNEEYEAAQALVVEMAETFGYREEADRFHRQIDDAQSLHRRHLIDQAILRVDEICAAHDWDRAVHEANHIARTYPDVSDAANLHERIEQARESHKSELERAFLEAAEHDDVDRALTLMKEMDRYLTPAESEPYRETARGVIGQKRENLGVQFKLSVSDRDWIAAMNVGQQIIQDFPNTKMAQEVRDMLDVLRERAAGQRAASR